MSSGWLQMSWHQIGTRLSATTVLPLTWLECHIDCIMQQMPHVTAIEPKKCLRDWQHVGFFVIDRYSNKALWPVMGSHGVSFLSLGTYFADVFFFTIQIWWKFEILLHCYSIPAYDITTFFCSFQNCGAYFIKMWMRGKRNFHYILIVMKKCWWNEALVHILAWSLQCSIQLHVISDHVRIWCDCTVLKIFIQWGVQIRW